MTDTTRIDLIEKTFLRILSSTDGATEARKQLDSLNVTTKELLAFANKPYDLPKDFDPDQFLKFSSDDLWEEEQRTQREVDELAQVATSSEISCEEDHPCCTCGNTCVPEQCEDLTIWICEACYNGYDDDDEYGNTGLDWNDSGYFD